MILASLNSGRGRAILLFLSILLSACGSGGDGTAAVDTPTAPAPNPNPTAVAGVSITTESLVAQAGGNSVALTASTDATGPVTWTLEAGSPGRLDTTTGITVNYIPPAADAVDETETVIITASAGGSSKKLTLVLEGGEPPPPPQTPPAMPQKLTVAASSPIAVPGGGSVTLTAMPPSSSDAVQWSLEAGSPGSLSAGSGNSVLYFPPATAAPDTQVTVIAASGGQTRKTTLLLQGTQGLSVIAGNDFGAGLRDGAGAAARFYRPAGLVRDSAGNLYVGDVGNHTIRRIAPDGTASTIAGMPGEAGHRDGTGATARLTAPRNIALGADGNLYLTDMRNHTVRRVTPAGEVTTIAGSAGVTGDADGTGSAARFDNPAGIGAGPDGMLYVADAYNSLIRTVTPDGVVGTYAGIRGKRQITNGNTAVASFIDPMSLTVDAAGNVYVADGYFSPPEPNAIAGISIIRKISPQGEVSSLAGGFYPETSGNADGTGDAARFFSVTGMTTDSAGNVYVGDGRIRKISPQGEVSTFVPRAEGQLSTAGGLSFAADGTLYFTDLSDHVVRARDASGAIETLAGAAPLPGSADGSGTDARFYQPKGIAADSAGNRYVADTFNHTVRRIGADGTVTTLAGSPRNPGSADGTSAAARFYYPRDVAVDSAGNVYVADSLNYTVRKITPAGVVSTLAGSAGQPGSTDGTGSEARLSTVEGIAIDDGGNVYITGQLGYTVRKISPDGVVSTLAGSPDQYGDADGTGSSARFAQPGDLVIDKDGNLYVLDAGDAIRKVTPEGVVTTVAGGFGMSGNADGNGAAARFDAAQGLAIDDAGNLYVADTGNNAVRRVTPDGTVSTVAGAEGQVAEGSLFRPERLTVTGPKSLAITSGNGVFRLNLP